MSSQHEEGQARYYGLETGTVIDNADPLGLGRVRVRVPGIIEESPWALPLGTVGGGKAQRGFFDPPDVGADVGILFHRGHPQHPFYLPGHWGKPGGVSEAPTPVKNAAPADATKVKAYETARWLITFDERAGAEILRIEDKKAPDLKIELDGKALAVVIEGTTSIQLKSVGTISIDAAKIQIGGRVVMQNGKPL